MFMSCVFQLPLPFFLIASFMARKTGQVLNSPLVALDTASYQYLLGGILRVWLSFVYIDRKNTLSINSQVL